PNTQSAASAIDVSRARQLADEPERLATANVHPATGRVHRAAILASEAGVVGLVSRPVRPVRRRSARPTPATCGLGTKEVLDEPDIDEPTCAGVEPHAGILELVVQRDEAAVLADALARVRCGRERAATRTV